MNNKSTIILLLTWLIICFLFGYVVFWGVFNFFYLQNVYFYFSSAVLSAICLWLFLRNIMVNQSLGEVNSELRKLKKEAEKSESEMEKKIKELESFFELTVNRELKMVELKKQLKRFKEKNGSEKDAK